VLLGGFAGTVALAATLSTTAAIAELFGAEHPPNVTYALLGWLRKRLSVSDVGATTLARVALNKALVQNRNLQKSPPASIHGGRNVDRDDVGEG
jgi:hypothetical protein